LHSFKKKEIMKTRKRGGGRQKNVPQAKLLNNLKPITGIPNEAINRAYRRSTIKIKDVQDKAEREYLSEVPDFIEIRKSTISNAGNGVFAVEDLPASKPLGLYLGKAVPDTAHGDYVLDTGAGFSVNAKPFAFSTWTRFLNTASWRGVANVAPNVRFVRYVDPFNTFAILVESTRNIRAGEELIVDYGGYY